VIEFEITSAGMRSMGKLPQSAHAAAVAFILGPLLENPWQVSKPLREPYEDQRVARVGEYRLFFTLVEQPTFDLMGGGQSNPSWLVTITAARHRRDAYRT
jgi:mRNA-degrading endonuclease RelE of RelBE toxin-antitoxin system